MLARLTALLICLPAFFTTVSLGQAPTIELGASSTETAQSEAQPPEPSSQGAAPIRTVFERVTIVGTDEVSSLPGSARALKLETLEEQAHTDIQRILMQIPGVVVQEEDGLGLRPNIGLRGTGVERSSKITLLEDGVLIAPAPYTAPAAYYFPTAGRMETVEVRTGSASIEHGPYTTGGAINLVSRSVPSTLAGAFNLKLGQHDTSLVRSHIGDSAQRVGWLIDVLRHETSGFKDLDGPSDGTGTTVEDATGKLRLNSANAARLSQQFELKFGRTDQTGHETYLGLTQADFDRTPLRRYSGSALDLISTKHQQGQGRHFIQLGGDGDLITTIYQNDFARDWFKTEKVLGVSNGDILTSPTAHPIELAILRGDINSVDDAITLRHNDREYQSRGIQSMLTWYPSLDEAPKAFGRHQLQIGLRYHEDFEDRLQHEELFRTRDRTLERTTLGAPGSQSNRLSTAEATSAFAQDTFRFNRLTIRAGLRAESISYERFDFSKADPERVSGPTRVRANAVDVLIPGVGIDLAVTDRSQVFLGVHRGFSPPGAGANKATREEESTSYEFGYRRTNGKWTGDAVLFATDYTNLLGRETISGGGSGIGELFNGGEVDIRGLELSARTILAEQGSWRFPLRFAYTLSDAEFDSAFNTSFADWAPRVEIGDELPYLPEHQVHASIGVQHQVFSVFTSASWTSTTRSNAGQGPIAADQRIGSRLLVDITARWRFSKRWSVFAQGRNLLDKTYVAARRPYGLRPGLPRTLAVGVDLDF